MGKNKRTKGKSKAPGGNSNGGPQISEDSNVSALEQNQPKQISGDTESQQTGVSESDVDLDKTVVDDDKQHIIPGMEEKESLLNGKYELEERVQCLQEDVYQCLKKEAWMDMRLEELQSEMNVRMSKEALLNERIKGLEDDKESWILKQNSNKEMMCKLDVINAELQIKVNELGESRDRLSEENQQLMSNISILELRVQKLEETIVLGSLTSRSPELSPEDKDVTERTQSSSELVVRSVDDSQEVNKFYEERNRQSTSMENDLVVEFESSKGTVGDAPPSGNVSASYSSSNVLDTISIDDSKEASAIELSASAEHGGSQDILPLQLDEIEIQEVDSRPLIDTTAKVEAVPLTDAPLIGAPFRLISFMAKYVSGADLVKDDSRM